MTDRKAWLSGDTYMVREILSSHGWRWDPSAHAYWKIADWNDEADVIRTIRGYGGIRNRGTFSARVERSASANDFACLMADHPDLAWCQYEQGQPCKQGETAARSGCTPASGEDGGAGAEGSGTKESTSQGIGDAWAGEGSINVAARKAESFMPMEMSANDEYYAKGKQAEATLAQSLPNLRATADRVAQYVQHVKAGGTLDAQGLDALASDSLALAKAAGIPTDRMTAVLDKARQQPAKAAKILSGGGFLGDDAWFDNAIGAGRAVAQLESAHATLRKRLGEARARRQDLGRVLADHPDLAWCQYGGTRASADTLSAALADHPDLWAAQYSGGGSAKGQPCKQGQSAARTGCIPRGATEGKTAGARAKAAAEQRDVERKAVKEIVEKGESVAEKEHAEKAEPTGKLGKVAAKAGELLGAASAMLGKATDKIPGWKQAQIERALTGSGMFDGAEAKAVVQAAMNQETRPKAVAVAKAAQATMAALGKVFHATYALPIAANAAAKAAGWSEKTADLATKISGNVDWVTHGAASTAVLAAALGTMALKPRRTGAMIANGVKKAIAARGGIKTAAAALENSDKRRAAVRAAQIAEKKKGAA